MNEILSISGYSGLFKLISSTKNGIIVEDEGKAEQDEARKKRMLASAFVMVRNKTGMNRKEFAAWLIM